MKEVLDPSGHKIKGLRKGADGSFLVIDKEEYDRITAQHNIFEKINTEMAEMRAQLNVLLEKLK